MDYEEKPCGLDVLYGEKVDLVSRPHPLSFLRYHLYAVSLIFLSFLLGWFYNYLKSDNVLLGASYFLQTLFGTSEAEALNYVFLILFWVSIILNGFIFCALGISRLPIIGLSLVGAFGTFLELYPIVPSYILLVEKPLVKALLLGIAGIAGVILTEIYRRKTTYFLTNYRIVIRRGLLVKEELEQTYEKIMDVHLNQNIIGRIFNYGDITPLSSSILGVEWELSKALNMAHLPIEKGLKKIRRYSLNGIRDPKKVKVLIEKRRLETEEASILSRIEPLEKDNKKERRYEKML